MAATSVRLLRFQIVEKAGPTRSGEFLRRPRPSPNLRGRPYSATAFFPDVHTTSKLASRKCSPQETGSGEAEIEVCARYRKTRPSCRTYQTRPPIPPHRGSGPTKGADALLLLATTRPQPACHLPTSQHPFNRHVRDRNTCAGAARDPCHLPPRLRQPSGRDQGPDDFCSLGHRLLVRPIPPTLSERPANPASDSPQHARRPPNPRLPHPQSLRHLEALLRPSS